MDRVRLGRVLGRGARLAAQTAYEAVDAATTKAPVRPGGTRSVVSTEPAASVRTAPQRPVAAPEVLRPFAAARQAPLVRAARAAGSGFAGPLRRASRALWLELTGCFFALFALSFGLGAWRTRAELKSAIPLEQHRAEAFCLLALVFLYFSVSSFVRARRTA